MKGRAFLTFLTLLIASAGPGPALAQHRAADRPQVAESGWIVTSSSYSCAANFELPSEGLSLRAARSYRYTIEPTLWVSARLDRKFAPTDAPLMTLRIAGDDLPIGEEQVFPSGESLSVVSVGVLRPGIERLVARGGPVTLEFVIEGEVVGQWATDAFADDTALLEDCFTRVGQELLAARAPSDDGSPGERDPTPRLPPANWVSSFDYPSVALRSQLSGRAAFRLVVDRYGFPRECVITETSGHQVLDDATCKTVMRRASFYPARDAEGNATTGSYAQAVRWMVPE